MSGTDLARYPNLWKRGTRYYVRVRVPADLRLVEKREHVVISLRTSDYREAIRGYRDVHGQIERRFELQRAEVAARDTLSITLGKGQLDRLTDHQIEGLVRDWFETRAHLRRPIARAGEEMELLLLLQEDARDLDEIDPAVADVTHAAADQLLADAGVPVGRRRVGRGRPVVERNSRQYRYLFELVGRALRAENAMAQQFLLGRPIAQIDPLLNSDRPSPSEFGSGRQGRSLAELIDAYRKDRERAHGLESTDRKYAHIFRALKEALGPDKHVADINRRDCRAVRDFLETVPKNATKHYPKLSLADAAKAGAREGRPCLAPTTVASYMNNLCALLNWAVHEEWINRNPAKGLVERRRAQVRRRGFSPDELKALFSALALLRRAQPERFWVPALALYTGARAGEICQLQAGDVIEVEGVWCINLSEFGADGRRVDDKTLKTDASERIVPLHPQLLAAGFRTYVSECLKVGQDRLFPTLVAGPKGTYSHEFSKWFGRFRRSIGLGQPALVFHSFRHGFRDACRLAHIPEETARALGGWAATNQAARYGDRGMVHVLDQAVRKLDFGGFRLADYVSAAGSIPRRGLKSSEK